MNEFMEEEVYNAAVNGDLTIFDNKNHDQLLSKTSKYNNIIHIAAKYQQLDFIKAALNSFPTKTCESLLRDQNHDRNTPFHIAAQVRNEPIIIPLYEFYSKQCMDPYDGLHNINGEPPWMWVNWDGNTPAHVALQYGNVSVAMYLVEKNHHLAYVTNHSEETLLHVAIQYDGFDNPDSDNESWSKKVYQPREDICPIIKLLLKIKGSEASLGWSTNVGSTLLHRAASLDPTYCIRVIKAMLASCPEAASVQEERSGLTVLHLLTNHQVASYEQGMELLQIPQVYALINIQDDQGDTPLHLAARNRDTTMVRVLLGCSPKLGLKNKNGDSADSLLRQLEVEEMEVTDSPVEHRRKLTREECEAAKRGDVAFLNEKLVSMGINFLVSKTTMGGNILHILMQRNFNGDLINKVIEFIRQAIQVLPSLISQQDRKGNTLVHLVADKTYSYTLRSLIDDLLMVLRKEAWCLAKGGVNSSPFRLKNNVKGDTPLHVAVRDGNYYFAIKLLELDEEVAGYVNIRKQTPLHLLSLHFDRYYDEEVDELISRLIDGNADVPYMQDEDGLTPLLTAVRERNLLTIRKLHEQFPDSTEITDFKGRTLWHLFGSRRLERDLSSAGDFDGLTGETWKFLIDQDVGGHIRRLMASKDNDGNTPLHLAIQNRNFDFAQFFLDNWRDDWSVKDKYEALLAIENKDGVSSYNLIGSADHLPPEVTPFFCQMRHNVQGANPENFLGYSLVYP